MAVKYLMLALRIASEIAELVLHRETIDEFIRDVTLAIAECISDPKTRSLAVQRANENYEASVQRKAGK